MVAEYHNQSKLRFWCQMVLPLVYDDSLSYMELLNKVVSYLNNCIQDVGNCETNIESLLEAFVNLQDYVNEIVEDVGSIIEEKIDEMIESGEFGEILADALATVVAPEYETTESYIPLNYVIKDGQLYCCTANTTGEWDSTKWRETTVGDELNTLMQKVYSLNAGQVSYSGNATYDSGTVGKELKDLHGAVNNEKDELNAIQNNIIIEQGGIADSTGKDAENEARLRTKGFLPPHFTIIVAQPTTYDIRVKGTYYYDENDNFVQYLERNSYRVTVDESTNPNKYKVRLSFWANDREQAITPSDLILSNYQVEDGIQGQIVELNGAINSNESAMAIVANGDTHPAIAENQMVYIKNHSTLAEGLYRANTNIPLNGALSGNVTSISGSGGGLNNLNAANMDAGISTYTQALLNKYMGANRYDITNLETFDASIDSGTVSFVRNRTGYPTSNYNYSPGIYFKPTETESLWVMFGRNTNDIVLKIKNTTWESGWHYISST